eukprot:scpid110589/ scgid26090/ 
MEYNRTKSILIDPNSPARRRLAFDRFDAQNVTIPAGPGPELPKDYLVSTSDYEEEIEDESRCCITILCVGVAVIIVLVSIGLGVMEYQYNTLSTSLIGE